MSAAGSPRQYLTLPEATLQYAHDFAHIVEVGGDNRGTAVEFFQRCAKIPPGAAWCAAFVNACAELGAAVRNKEPSPLEGVGQEGFVADYVSWAKAGNLLVPFGQIQPGDLFCLWFTNLNRHAHIGFVDAVDVGPEMYATIEGNTDDQASREGIKVARRIRSPGARDVFVRWA